MTNTQQPLALRADAPAVFGSRDEIKALSDRMKAMMPSARLADWQMSQAVAKRAEAEQSLSECLFKAAQLCVFYRLVPGEDVHIIPYGNRFSVDMGIETWKKAADRFSSLHHVTYHIHTREMTLEDLKVRRGKEYDPEDVGMVAYLWRSDKEGVYRIFGAEESMSRACGVWAKKAKEVKGEWKPDTIPAQRSKQDVAKRRAMKAVLKLEFSLDSLLAATPNEIRDNVGALEMTLRTEERRTALTANRSVEVDEDGCIIVDPQPARQRVNDVEFIVAAEQQEEPSQLDEPEIDDLWEPTDAAVEQTAESDGIDYRALTAKLKGVEAKFVDWARQAHADSAGESTPEQYRYLVGVLNAITGDKQSYRLLLGAMCGRYVHSGNRPGIKLVDRLLEWLVKERKDEVTGKKVANPAYRVDYVDCIKSMYAGLTEASK